jgi:hypothetical protein
MAIWRMRIASWIPKATNTHSGCVIIIVFPLQQWLCELASMLSYTHNAGRAVPLQTVQLTSVIRLILGLPNGFFSPVLSTKI